MRRWRGIGTLGILGKVGPLYFLGFLGKVSSQTSNSSEPSAAGSSASSAAATSPGKQRLVYLDLFRGLAVFFMFDAHITDAVFPLAEHNTALHRWHFLSFGLPAPSFLFAAGISFGIAVYSRWETFRGFTPTVRGRIARLCEVLLVAYLLHLPASSLSATLRATTTEIRKLIGWDILQLIGYMSLLLLAVAVAAPRREWFTRATWALLLAVALSTAWLWDLRLVDDAGAAVPIAGLPWWITSTLSKQLGSNFPIFPYSAFLFAGVLWGCGHVRAAERGAERIYLRRTLVWGAMTVAACLLLARAPLPAPYDDFWAGSPVYLLLRIGLLCAILGALHYLEDLLAPRLHFLLLFSRESLVIYFTHLVIVYGSPLTAAWNYRHAFRNTSGGLLTWLALYTALALAMIAFGKLWSWLKARLGDRFDRAQWAAAALAVLVFLLR
jgi:hypothetical protein